MVTERLFSGTKVSNHVLFVSSSSWRVQVRYIDKFAMCGSRHLLFQRWCRRNKGTVLFVCGVLFSHVGCNPDFWRSLQGIPWGKKVGLCCPCWGMLYCEKQSLRICCWTKCCMFCWLKCTLWCYFGQKCCIVFCLVFCWPLVLRGVSWEFLRKKLLSCPRWCRVLQVRGKKPQKNWKTRKYHLCIFNWELKIYFCTWRQHFEQVVNSRVQDWSVVSLSPRHCARFPPGLENLEFWANLKTTILAKSCRNPGNFFEFGKVRYKNKKMSGKVREKVGTLSRNLRVQFLFCFK